MEILIEEFKGSIWAAAIQNGRLQGLEVDPVHEAVRWGSVYWAKITRFDTAQDAAFLNLDGENTGILYNKDVRLRDQKGKVIKGGDKAISKIFNLGDMVAVQAKTAYLPLPGRQDLLEDKNAQMSMDITIPGRYLVLCPMMEENQVSQRVQKDMRLKLTKMMDSLENMRGFILRASGADLQTDILVREGKIIREIWNQVQSHLAGSEPSLIMLGPDSIQRVLGDNATQPIERIEIVTMDHFQQVEDWCSIFAPDLVTKIVPVEIKDAVKDLALFEHRDILSQIQAVFQDYTVLPGGGNVIVQRTAALTAIDVNKGSDARGNLAVNVEAAYEIARQIRLRNAGGVIMVDFLRLKERKDEMALLEALETAIGEDPCTIQIHGFTKLGLLEMTRKRRMPPLQDKFDNIMMSETIYD